MPSVFELALMPLSTERLQRAQEDLEYALAVYPNKTWLGVTYVAVCRELWTRPALRRG